MATNTTWSNWFVNQASNDAGNQNLKAFSEILISNDNDANKLRQLVKGMDTVILQLMQTNAL
jgi:hypothetical protein